MSDITVQDRVKDAINLCYLKSVPRFVGFLSPSEAAEVTPLLSSSKHFYFGGYDMAERTYLGIFPDWCEISEELFPITPVSFTFKECYKLTHRDFLGTLMSLGIKRSAVGDIVIENGYAVAFVNSDITDYIVSQISKVGGVGVKVQVEAEVDVTKNSKFLECSATVSSNRVDSVVAALITKGRTKAVELIAEGAVSINSKQVSKNTQSLNCGDVVSIRKYGKFLITSAESKTKKGRLIIEWKKYI